MWISILVYKTNLNERLFSSTWEIKLRVKLETVIDSNMRCDEKKNYLQECGLLIISGMFFFFFFWSTFVIVFLIFVPSNGRAFPFRSYFFQLLNTLHVLIIELVLFFWHFEESIWKVYNYLKYTCKLNGWSGHNYLYFLL